MKEFNAIIESTTLGIERCFSFWLHLAGDGWCQGYGGWVLDTVPEKIILNAKRRPTKFGCAAIMQVLHTLEVEAWEKLPGTPVRVRKNDELGKIVAIGHFVKNKWLDLDALAKQYPDDSKEAQGE